MIEALAFVKKFWKWGVIFVLVFVVLYMRNDLTAAKADRDTAEAAAKTLDAVNKANVAVIKGFSEQRLANDKIIQSLALDKTTNKDHETNVRIMIDKAATDDKETRDWLSVPVPSGVRKAIEH